MDRICILMSTYNGERYLKDQIDSLLAQDNVVFDICIRDDGSTDGTLNILRQYESRFTNIKIQAGENVGYEKSFYSLMKNVGVYQYYAFSDQDDIWDKDKLICAVEAMWKKETNKPLLYMCNLRLVNENLLYICDMKAPDARIFQKGSYLVDKYGYGCTYVFNRALKDLALRYEPKIKISHDNWVGLIDIFMGDHIFDSQTHISYRQHSNNVMGGDNGQSGIWRRRIKALRNIKQYSRALVAQEILNGYSDLLGHDDVELLELVANYRSSIKNKISLLRNREIRRVSKEKNMWFRIMTIFSLA